jgi:predicted secreted protein
MTTKAKMTKGLRIQRGDGGGTEVFTTIGEITNFSGPNESADQVDVTSFDSTAREFIAGMNDNGEVSFDMNFLGNDAQQQGLRTDLRNGTLRNFKVLLADSTVSPTTFAFSAIVTSFDGPKGGVGQAVTASIKVKLSGQATVTYTP